MHVILLFGLTERTSHQKSANQMCPKGTQQPLRCVGDYASANTSSSTGTPLRQDETCNSCSRLAGNGVGQPIKALVQPLTRSGARALNVPVWWQRVWMRLSFTTRDLFSTIPIPLALTQRVQAQLVSNLCGTHSIRQILLVGKHQQYSITQLIL